MNSIPTVYNGIQFRSRLEARWAAFFDLCRWHWAYEPFDMAGYIPDFAIHPYKSHNDNKVMRWIPDMDSCFLVEVKPITEIDKEAAVKMEDAAISYIKNGGTKNLLGLILIGESPLRCSSKWFYRFGWMMRGWLIKYINNDKRNTLSWSDTRLISICQGGMFLDDTVPDPEGTGTVVFEDCEPRDGVYAEPIFNASVLEDSMATVNSKWKQACNLTQWKGVQANA